jgi:hypothetical protein
MLVINAFIYHISLVIFFSLLYFAIYDDNFVNSIPDSNEDPKISDCIYFATTIQAGVGLPSLNPKTHLSKMIVCIQQLLMISGNIFILTAFTHNITTKKLFKSIFPKF